MLSFASGWQPDDFALRPENYHDRHALLDRGIELVRRLWRGETLPFDGPHGPVEVRTLPRPIQPELPPSFLGDDQVGEVDGIERAAEEADPHG